MRFIGFSSYPSLWQVQFSVNYKSLNSVEHIITKINIFQTDVILPLVRQQAVKGKISLIIT